MTVYLWQIIGIQGQCIHFNAITADAISYLLWFRKVIAADASLVLLKEVSKNQPSDLQNNREHLIKLFNPKAGQNDQH